MVAPYNKRELANQLPSLFTVQLDIRVLCRSSEGFEAVLHKTYSSYLEIYGAKFRSPPGSLGFDKRFAL